MTKNQLNVVIALGAAMVLGGCAAPPMKSSSEPMSSPAKKPMPAPAKPAPAVQAAPSSVDMLETILTRVADSKDVQISKSSTGALLLRATGDTAFASGSSALRPDFTDFLKQLANGLQTYSNLSMRVTGHTDNTGAAQLNDKLSEARAVSTINFLVSQGVPAGRLLAEGRGQTEPIASNDSAEGRASNRRVDMLIIELGK